MVFALLANVAHAGQLVNVYRAEVLVKTQAEAERNEAARATLGQVIVRVSGQLSALDNPIVQSAVKKAQNYLFGFTYQSSNQKITEDGKVYPAVSLQLNYSPQAIEHLLRQAQLPIWPAQRPKVLVWLVAKDQAGLHLVPEPTALAALQAQAIYRGLPVITPKMDLEDSLSLTGDDLWQLNLEKIRAASLRYKVDAVLIGRYTPYAMGPIPLANAGEVDPQEIDIDIEMASSAAASASNAAATTVEEVAPPQGPWIGDWQLLQGDALQAFNNETPEVAGLFEFAVDRAADYFAAQYAIMPSNQGPQTIVLNVANVGDFGAFKQVQAYLQGLAMVRHLELLRVNSDSLLVAITTEGDVRLLMSTLALGKKLVPIASESMPVLQSVVAQPDASIQANSDAQQHAAIDTSVAAELDAALAAEQGVAVEAEGTVETAPVVATPAHAGTNDDPLLYVWQAK